MSDSPTDKQSDSKPAAPSGPDYDYFSRHMKFGWWSLCLFMLLGFFLEYLHGFKVDYYLNVGNEMRRLMFTLAHAHGTLFGSDNTMCLCDSRCVGVSHCGNAVTRRRSYSSNQPGSCP